MEPTQIVALVFFAVAVAVFFFPVWTLKIVGALLAFNAPFAAATIPGVTGGVTTLALFIAGLVVMSLGHLIGIGRSLRP